MRPPVLSSFVSSLASLILCGVAAAANAQRARDDAKASGWLDEVFAR